MTEISGNLPITPEVISQPVADGVIGKTAIAGVGPQLGKIKPTIEPMDRTMAIDADGARTSLDDPNRPWFAC